MSCQSYLNWIPWAVLLPALRNLRGGLCQVASVVGHVFSMRMVSRIYPLDIDFDSIDIAELEEKNLIICVEVTESLLIVANAHISTRVMALNK